MNKKNKSNHTKTIDRRRFMLKTGIAAGLVSMHPSVIGFAESTPKTNIEPILKGANIGVITYSFRSMPSGAEDLLGYLTGLGLSSVELMGDPAEIYAGAPQGPAKRWGNMSEEEKKELAVYYQEMKKWRSSVSMKKFKELGKKYQSNGVSIEIIKLPLDRMSPEEIHYSFKVADALGAKGITLERNDASIQKLSPYADKYNKLIGYHNHAEVNFNSWDVAMQKSKYNAINLDVGHYVAGTNKSPIPLIEKYHDRISNLHLKDRKMNNGENMPWGQGDTPLREILQLMRDKKYKFMGAIELEYPIPDGSDAVKEVGKCVEFCQNALES